MKSPENNNPGKSVLIFGKKTIQNESLKRLIATELKLPCTLQNDLATFFPKMLVDGEQIVLLLDNFYISLDTFFDYIENSEKRLCGQFIIAVFNVDQQKEFERYALNKGVRGFFYNDFSIDLLMKGINSLFCGDVWIKREVLIDYYLNDRKQNNARSTNPANLTFREMEILMMISRGAKNAEISDKLFISTNTVKTHLYNIYKKIKVPNRMQAALWAARYL